MAVTDWNPARYAAFRGLRLRPALDLLAQVPELPSGDVVDLGCGDGAGAGPLTTRFPGRPLIGVDASPAMLAKAAGYAEAVLADIADWCPAAPPALIFSNAALHWLDNHAALLPRLAGLLTPGGTLAVQMPRNFNAPSHALLRTIAADLFPDRFDLSAWTPPVAPPAAYWPILAPLGHLSVWETDYLQGLAPQPEGHPVRAFTASTAMRPFVQRLTPAEATRFTERYDEALQSAYPALPDVPLPPPVSGSDEVLMPALMPTAFSGTVTWLGAQRRPVEALEIFAEAVAEMPLTLAGFAGEIHAGLTRPSCSRVLSQHPRGTTIRNVRQLSLVSAEELGEVAARLKLDRIDPAWLGASVVIAGLPDFSHLPPSSRLQGPDGVTLVVDMQNLPCQEPAVTMAKATGGLGKGFKAAARGRRGVTAWVEREGTLRIGDSLRLHIPDQRPWAQLETARCGAAG